MEKFIAVVAVEEDGERSLKFMAGRFPDKQTAITKVREGYGASVLIVVVFTAKEFEERSQQLLSAEPDPPWKRISPN